MSRIVQLAPMLGLTDPVFINALHNEIGGYNEMFLPYMVASDTSLIKENILRRRLAEYQPEINIVPQLLGNQPMSLIYFANRLYDLGYQKVNWNLGCPQPFVTKKVRGAGLLLYPEKIEHILDEIVPKLKPALSVKTRLGFTSPDEAFRLMEIFNKYPVCELILHARTAEQQYSGEPLYDDFYAVAFQAKMPVIYNGDVVRLSHAVAIEKQFQPLKGFMIGRGAFINPFIGLQILGDDAPVEERYKQFVNFYRVIYQGYQSKSKSDNGLLNHMKELWSLFGQAFVNSGIIIQQIKKTTTIKDFNDEVERIIMEEEWKI